MMRRLTLLAAFLASPAIASDVNCTFTQECIDGESCSETSYAVTVEDFNRDRRAITLVSDSETLRGTIIEDESPLHLLFVGNSAAHLVTVTTDNSARYTVHMDGPLAITYHGVCEGFE